jgi:hypothetical protein
VLLEAEFDQVAVEPEVMIVEEEEVVVVAVPVE